MTDPSDTGVSSGIDLELHTDRDDPAWAHASGWAQLSGRRQTVTCLLPHLNQAHVLSQLLPVLSDTLTECGYPWELLLIDCGSRDGTTSLLQAWTELPGFRSLRLQPPQTVEGAFAAGLLAARGDAVILFDPGVVYSPELIPRMMLLWESDALLVHALRDPDTGRTALAQWSPAETRRRMGRPDFALPPECIQLSLLDKELVKWLKEG